MKALSTFSALVALAISTSCSAQGFGSTRITYNVLYDNPGLSSSFLACSQWAAENNYTTLSDVPNFPYVGAANVVSATNTGNCGDCYSIFDERTGNLIDVTVVDATGTGFVISLQAMNDLTDGNSIFLDVVTAIVDQVPNDQCQA